MVASHHNYYYCDDDDDDDDDDDKENDNYGNITKDNDGDIPTLVRVVLVASFWFNNKGYCVVMGKDDKTIRSIIGCKSEDNPIVVYSPNDIPAYRKDTTLHGGFIFDRDIIGIHVVVVDSRRSDGCQDQGEWCHGKDTQPGAVTFGYR